MNHNRKIIYLVGFLFSIPTALAAYINSSFLSSLISERLVGIVYALGSITSIIALVVTPLIFSKIGGKKFLLAITLLSALTFGIVAFSKNTYIVVFAFILGFALNTLIVFSIDELLKIFSKNSNMGESRGMYISSCHVAWIMAQLLSSTILAIFPLRAIYLISFLFMIVLSLLTASNLHQIPEPEYDKKNFFKYTKEFFKNKNLFRAYSMGFLVQFFFCWMIIYTPIYLSLHLGFSWKEIGVIFAIMLVPFLIIPIPLGRYGDKIGERKILMYGFFVTAFSTLSLFFIREHNFWLWTLLLFTTRIGAAAIEVISDSYFFKHIKPENDEYVGIYRSASPVAYIVGPVSAFLILLFVPSFNFIYLILGGIMFYGIYLSSTIRKGDI